MSYAWLHAALLGDKLEAALSAARRVPHVKLAQALRICILMAANAHDRYEAAAVRWVIRLLEEHPQLALADLHATVQALSRLPADRPVALAILIPVLERYQLTDEVAAAEQPVRWLEADAQTWKEELRRQYPDQYR